MPAVLMAACQNELWSEDDAEITKVFDCHAEAGKK
jgi:hypothetical protein